MLILDRTDSDKLTLNKKIVIAIPIYKTRINLMEATSLRQLIKITNGKYSIRLIAPKDLDVSCYMNIIPETFDVTTEEFPKEFFIGIEGYNKLWVNQILYERINAWKYVLIYHLDAFLFSDDLEAWCEEGYDSIGAPIYEFNGTNNPVKYLGTGNGGFCMRNIASCLKVLNQNKIVYTLKDIKGDFLKYNFKGRISRCLYYIDMISTMGSRSSSNRNRIRVNEDYFWSVLVPASYLWFKVPERLTAAKFSLEYNHENLYRENDNIMPFGCHGWYKPMLAEFWVPIFKEIGIEIIL